MVDSNQQLTEAGREPLKNLQYEAFCNMVATGGTFLEAYRKAGFKSKNDSGGRSSAHKLYRRPEVGARIRYLRGESDKPTVITVLNGLVLEKVRDRQERMYGLEDLRRRILMILQARENDTKHRDVAGYASGLLTVSYRRVGQGNKGKVMKECRYDSAIIADLLAIDKQQAIELHQWNEPQPELPWDGDLRSAPKAWLDKWEEHILNLIYKGDPEKIAQAKAEYEAKRKGQPTVALTTGEQPAVNGNGHHPSDKS